VGGYRRAPYSESIVELPVEYRWITRRRTRWEYPRALTLRQAKPLSCTPCDRSADEKPGKPAVAEVLPRVLTGYSARTLQRYPERSYLAEEIPLDANPVTVSLFGWGFGCFGCFFSGVFFQFFVFSGVLFVRCLARLVVHLCVNPVVCLARALGPRRSRTNKEPKGPHRYRDPVFPYRAEPGCGIVIISFAPWSRLLVPLFIQLSCPYCDYPWPHWFVPLF
jgi:hypothetical protein